VPAAASDNGTMNISKWVCTGTALYAALLAGAAAAQSVALDIGHFLEKPGAMSARGREEFGFNRELALEIARALKERGLRTQLIGADGAQIRLSARATQGRGADFFLSVHHDSVQPHFLEAWTHAGEARNFSDRYAGFSLFVSRRNPALGARLACASALGEALRRAGFRPSLYHADPIAGESKPFADRANGVHYYDNLVVLKTAASPAVLFEAGVIVNRDEELVLGQIATRERIAVAVAAGLGRCLDAPGMKRER
jgi:N-acetylmuramoyl-L-alanine amidase